MPSQDQDLAARNPETSPPHVRPRACRNITTKVRNLRQPPAVAHTAQCRSKLRGHQLLVYPPMYDRCMYSRICFGAVLGRCWPVLCRHVTGFGRCWGDFGRLADVGRCLICFCRFWLGVADIWPKYGYSYCTRVHTRPAGHAFVFLCTGHVVGQRPGRT